MRVCKNTRYFNQLPILLLLVVELVVPRTYYLQLQILKLVIIRYYISFIFIPTRGKKWIEQDTLKNYLTIRPDR